MKYHFKISTFKQQQAFNSNFHLSTKSSHLWSTLICFLFSFVFFNDSESLKRNQWFLKNSQRANRSPLIWKFIKSRLRSVTPFGMWSQKGTHEIYCLIVIVLSLKRGMSSTYYCFVLSKRKTRAIQQMEWIEKRWIALLFSECSSGDVRGTLLVRTLLFYLWCMKAERELCSFWWCHHRLTERQYSFSCNIVCRENILRNNRLANPNASQSFAKSPSSWL